MADLTVRLQNADGAWETVGSGTYVGVRPEGVTLAANTYGPDTAGFNLKRDPGSIFPDLAAYTPIEILHGGRIVWGGEVKETPTNDGEYTINVQARGWQYTLDDDVYARTYVKTDLSAWKDQRSLLYAPLDIFTQVGKVTTGDGGIVLGWATDDLLVNGMSVGVALDLGRADITRVVIGYEVVAGAGSNVTLRAWQAGGHAPFSGIQGNEIILPVGSGTMVADWATPARFTSLLLYYFGTTTGLTSDITVKITSVQCFGSTAYENTNRSVLKASDVIFDAADKAAPTLSHALGSLPYNTLQDLNDPAARWSFGTPFVDPTPASWIPNQTGDPTYNLDASAGGYTVVPGFVVGDASDEATRYASGIDTRAATALFTGSGYANQSDWSIEAYIRTPASGLADSTIFYNGKADQPNGFGLRISTGGFFEVVFSGVTQFTSTYSPSASTIYHVIATYEAATAAVTLYVNGTQVLRQVGVTPYTKPTSGWVSWGSYGTRPINAVFTGDVDEGAVYNVVLDPATVNALYHAAFDPQFGRIARSSFTIPEFSVDDYKTPREVGDAVNAYHNWLFGVDAEKRVYFQPRPSRPFAEVGAWGGSSFQDASANSGEEIYNRALITGTDAAGDPLVIERTTANLSDAVFVIVSSPGPSNPNFDTDVTGTSATNGSVTRDLTIKDTGASSARWDKDPGDPVIFSEDYLELTFNGTFLAGTPYRLNFRLRTTTGYSRLGAGSRFGVHAVDDWGQGVRTNATGEFRDVTISWQPRITYNSGVTLRLYGDDTSTQIWLDTVTLSTSITSVLDRRGKRRTKTLPIDGPLTVVGGTQLADVFLTTSRFTPLKGSLDITGSHALRSTPDGRPMHPIEALGAAGQRIRLSHRVDPDTGHFGRDGVLESVTYNDDENSANLVIDSTRKNFEAYLARLGALTSQIRG